MDSKNAKNPVIITEEDFALLKSYINTKDETAENMTLSSELKRAVVVKREELPLGTIRIDSTVKVLDIDSSKVLKFKLVMPAHVDVVSKKFSILSIMGGALIGFRKNDEVQWRVPAGMKRFKIIDVINE